MKCEGNSEAENRRYVKVVVVKTIQNVLYAAQNGFRLPWWGNFSIKEVTSK